MIQSDSQEQLLCEKQVATALGISVQTVRRHRSRRAGVPFMRLGKLIRYEPAALRKFLEDSRA